MARPAYRPWDGKATLDDGTLDRPIGDQEKQYAGDVYATVAGIRLNIDRDVAAGPGRWHADQVPRRRGSGTSRGPGEPVRAKCRRLISSRHGPTQ